MIKLSQPAYVNKVFEKYHLNGVNTVKYLMKKLILLTLCIEAEVEVFSFEKKKY